MDFAEFKKFFLFNLAGSLIISAIIAVVTVLIGEFNEVMAKVLLTLFFVVVHSLIGLMFVWNNRNQETFERFSFFGATIFVILALSFITSIFGTWEIFSGETIGNIYQTYFVLAFAALHGEILAGALHKEKYIDNTIYVNYFFMAFVVLMLIPVIFVENATRVLGEMYLRILGAIGIIDGTLSILTIIFYKVFMHNHPKEESPLEKQTTYIQGNAKPQKEKKLSLWVWLLIAFLFLQIVLPLIFFFMNFSRF